MNSLLVVEDLVKYYPVRKGVSGRALAQVHAVDGVSFSIPRGKTLGLVGESGCGKTTLGRVILRLVEATSGTIVFDGRDVLGLKGSELRNLRRDMQVIFQDPYGSLNPRMRVGTMLEEPLITHGMKKREAREKVAQLLKLVGLESGHAGRYPHEFSGGQRQRIGIARALTTKPRFIVCDEPVSALDVSIQAQILNLLRDLQQTLDLTYLFISHDLSVVRHISDDIAVMYLGKIVESGPAEEIFSNPVHPYTQTLLSSIPKPVPNLRPSRARVPGDVPPPYAPPPGCRFHTRCPISIEACRAEPPALTEVSPGHLVACIRTEEAAAMRQERDRH